MTTRLIARPRTALAAIATSAAVVLVLGLLVHDDTGTNWFDSGVLRVIDDLVPARVGEWGLDLTDPTLVFGLMTLIALCGAVARRWDVVALTAAVPLISVLLTEEVLKPLVHRTNGMFVLAPGQAPLLAYPSGHETGLGSLVCVAGLLVVAAALPLRWKVLWCAMLAVALVGGAIGLIAHYYHFATDTIGAFGVTVSVTLTLALALDQVTARLAARQRPRTPVPARR